MAKVLSVALGFVLALMPMATAAAAEETARGTAKSNLELVRLDIDVTQGLLSQLQVVDGLLGQLAIDIDNLVLASGRSFASTDSDAARNTLGDGKPFALSGLTLPVLGESVARSDGQTRQEGANAELPAGLGGVRGGGLLAIVEGGEALSKIEGVVGGVNTLLGGVGASVPPDATTSVVNDRRAVAENGAIINDLSLNLGDLLPLDLLAQLPLQDLLDLLKTLPLDATQLESTVSTITELVNELKVLDTLTGTLAGLIAQLDPIVQELEDLLALDVIDADAVAALINDLGDVLSSIENVQTDITDLLGTIEGLLQTLTGLLDLVAGLLDDVAGLELVAIDRLAVGVDAVAREDGSNASYLCDLQGVSVLGQAAPAVSTCAQLAGALDTVSGTLLGTLNALPIVGTVTKDLVKIDGLRGFASEDNARDGAYHVAQSRITGLDVQIGSLSLGDLTNGLIDGLIAQLEDLLALLEGDLGDALNVGIGDITDGALLDLINDLLGGGVGNLVGGLEGLIGGLTDANQTASNDTERKANVRKLVDDLAGGSVLSGYQQAGLTDLVGTVLGVLKALPTGDLLDGLATPSVRLKALDLTADSQFAAAGVATPVTPTSNPAPLPKTGGGALALPLLLMALAAGAAAVVRARRPGVVQE